MDAPMDAGARDADTPAPTPRSPTARRPVPGKPEPRRSPSALPQVLTKRRDFLACARAARAHTPGILLQGRFRPDGEASGARIGFTCSKRIGNAVTRNRAKRRLREAARAVMPGRAREGWDYVLVGRPGATVARPFALLVKDLEGALDSIHRKARGR